MHSETSTQPKAANAAPLLNVDALAYLVAEVEYQCVQAIYAWNQLCTTTKHGLRSNDEFYEQTFFQVHALLTHAGNVSRLFWPPTTWNKARNEMRQRRGRQLKRAIHITKRSPLSSHKVRDHFEHYDERLEDWARQSKPSAGKRRDLEVVNSDGRRRDWRRRDWQGYHRVLDAYDMSVRFGNDVIRLQRVITEISRLRFSAIQWLKKNDRYPDELDSMCVESSASG